MVACTACPLRCSPTGIRHSLAFQRVKQTSLVSERSQKPAWQSAIHPASLARLAVLPMRHYAPITRAYFFKRVTVVQVSQPASIADNNYTDKPVPNAFWRAFSALIYLIPCMDTVQLGITTYGIVPQTLALFQIGGHYIEYYWAHQMVPLVAFFLVFLAIVKNKRLHHFVRFNAMQAMMLDILIMLPTVVNAYIPAEIFWTVLGMGFTSICFMGMFIALTYAVVFTLSGKYADIPFVSDSVYMQVYQIEFL